MSSPTQKNKNNKPKTSRRHFLKTVALTGASAGVLGFPAVMRAQTAAPIKINIQTVWTVGTTGYNKFQEFCREVTEITEGKVRVEGFQSGSIVETFQMFDAVKAGVLDAMHCFDIYWQGKIPVATFLSSYPFGPDHPDQWETWYYELGGIKIAKEAYGRHNMYYIGPIHHDDSLIHSRVPIRSFEDFKDKKIRFPEGIIADFFRTAGVSTATLPAQEIFRALESGSIDATDYLGADINHRMGIGKIAKYIIMGPPSRPCLHQPADIMSMEINMNKWLRIPKHYQNMITLAARKHAYDHYTAIQAADMAAFDKLQNEDGVELIRLTDADIEKFKPFAPPTWVKWAKKSTLSMKAFKSQLQFLKSAKIGTINDRDMVNLKGEPLVF